MSQPNLTNRRRFLRGLGTCIALPTMESIMPSALAQSATGLGGLSSSGRPLRMAYIYKPNGCNMGLWHPSSRSSIDFSGTLAPLETMKDHIQIISGLDHQKARANGDGGGDHARANATFLTGRQAKKTAGADIRIGVSVDQIAAEKIGQYTRLPSLELTCDTPRRAGSCDSGYSCSYQYNISWKSENLPMSPEKNPREAFDRLFSNQIRGEESENRAIRDAYNKSILDFVQEDTKNLRRYLGRTDQSKLDDYLETIREIERRIEAADKFAAQDPDYDRPKGVPEDYGEHMRIMYDLMAVAFQTDTTRIATFLTSHDGNNRSFKDIGVNEGHHSISHHQNNGRKLGQIADIDLYYVQQFSYFVEKLSSIQDGEGKLIDNCMVVFGAGISDPNRHSHSDLPVIVAGGGAGTLKPGRHVKANGKPMCDLYVSMLERIGVPTDSFGDSTGALKGI